MCTTNGRKVKALSRTITDREMNRRTTMAYAKSKITEVMAICPEMTPLEWCSVLNEMATRMIGHGLIEEWSEDKEESDSE